MSEWREVILKNITTKIGSGSTPTGGGESYKNEGISLVRSQNILDFEFSEQGLAFIDDNQAHELRGVTIKENDVLLNITGDSVARCCMIPKKILPARVNQHVAIIRANQEVASPNYILYNLLYQKETLLTFSEVGATRRALTKGIIEELEILLPPLPEQEHIAEVLSSLDDKIDLLHRNNKTLEQLAETLFRQWFEKVENEESTTIKNIEEVATVQNGYSFKSSEFITEQPDTIEVLKMGHISAEGGLRPSPKKDFVKRDEKYNKWILNKRDIILAMTDMKDNVVILGVPALIDQDNKYVLNQRVGRIFINDGSHIENILILYMQMKDKNFISELQSKGNSGVQVNLGTDTIRQTKVVVPSKDNQRKILPKLESIFDKLDQNRNQVQQLETLRDTLLPKLMSGVVRVEN